MYNEGYNNIIEWNLLRATCGENDAWEIPSSVYSPFDAADGLVPFASEIKLEKNVHMKYYALKRVLRDMYESELKENGGTEECEQIFLEAKEQVENFKGQIELVI